MSGPEDKPRGSFFDALRDRSRVVTTEAGATVPRRLSVAAAYGWRILVIAAVLGLGVWLVIQLKLLVVPMLVSILVAALLWPIFSWMVRHRFPKWLSIVVSAVVYANVGSVRHAILEVDDYMPATLQLAATTLRAVVGKMELDDILAKRAEINLEIRQILDERTEQWGVEITAVEIKDIALPQEMKRAMARQAEAERERRAKIIVSEGELQAAEKLAQAAQLIAAQPAALQLRTLQTLVEVSAERNNTIIFPIPIELMPQGGASAPAATAGLVTSAATALAAKQLKEAARGELAPAGQDDDPAEMDRMRAQLDALARAARREK